MGSTRPVDLFLTHAWRNHADWLEMVRLLDSAPGRTWRNFSLPWYDPALDPNTELGGRTVRDGLERQVIPAAAVIFLRGVYAVPSSRKWLDLEVGYARRHGKPVIAVPNLRDPSGPADDPPGSVDATCAWDAADILATVDRLAATAAPDRR